RHRPRHGRLRPDRHPDRPVPHVRGPRSRPCTPRPGHPAGGASVGDAPAAPGRHAHPQPRRVRRARGAADRPLRADRPGVRVTAAEPLVLGIETSCDETGVGIVRGRTLLTNTVASSMEEHVRFGGVVPEVASRAHVQAIGPMIHAALADADVRLEDLDAIAVTAGPGLSGALMVDAAAAKGLAAATGLPLYGINHLAAHVAVDLVAPDSPGLHTPTMALLVSGGHTEILRIGDIVDDIELLGATIDDAAGEAFDKTARLL